MSALGPDDPAPTPAPASPPVAATSESSGSTDASFAVPTPPGPDAVPPTPVPTTFGPFAAPGTAPAAGHHAAPDSVPPRTWAPAPQPATAAPLDLRQLINPALTAAVTYVAALLVSLVIAGLIIGSASSELELPAGAAGALTFFLTGMSFGGSLHASANASALASGAADLALIPWGTTVLAAAAGVWFVRVRSARAVATVRQRWADIVVTGTMLGLVAAIVAAAVHISWQTTIVIVHASARLSISPVGVLFGGFVTGALVAAIGHAWAGRSLTVLGVRMPAVLSEAARAVGIGMGVPAVVVAVVLTVLDLVKLGFTGGVALALGTLPTQVVWVNALGMFGSLDLSGAGSDDSASIAHSGSWLWLTLLVTVCSLVLTARARWARAGVVRPWQQAWAVPAVAGVGGVLAVLLTGVHTSWSGAAPWADEAGSGVSLGLSGLVILPAVLWGGLAEVLERHAGPHLVAAIPAIRLPGRATGVSGAVGGAPVVPGTLAAGAPSTLGAPLGAPVPGGATSAPAAPAVRTVKVSRRAAWTIVGVLALAVVVIVGRAVLASTVFTPQAPVTAYLNDLNAGHVSAAFAIADPSVPSGSRALLTDAVYGTVKDRPTGMHVTKVTRFKGGATVTTEGKQDGENVTQTFDVAAEGHRDLLFTRWVIKNPPVNEVVLESYGLPSTGTFVVNGLSFGFTDTAYVLPGTYDVSLGVDDDHAGLVTSTTATVQVRADEPTVNVAATAAGANLNYQLTDHAKELAASFAKSRLATCLASASLDHPGCSLWNATGYDDSLVSNVKWSLVGEPTYDVTFTSLDEIDVEITGQAQASYDAQPGWFDDGGPKTATSSIYYQLRLTPSKGELVQVDTGE